MFGNGKPFSTSRSKTPRVDVSEKDDSALREEREKTMRQFEKADRQEMVDARNYKPIVSVMSYRSGEFFCIQDKEWLLKYVESVEVENVGREPYWSHDFGQDIPVEAQRASIKVTMHSGTSHFVKCNRHQLDSLLDAVQTAWRKRTAITYPSKYRG